MKKIVFMVMMAMAVLSTNAQNEYPTAKVEKHDVADSIGESVPL